MTYFLTDTSPVLEGEALVRNEGFGIAVVKASGLTRERWSRSIKEYARAQAEMKRAYIAAKLEEEKL